MGVSFIVLITIFSQNVSSAPRGFHIPFSLAIIVDTLELGDTEGAVERDKNIASVLKQIQFTTVELKTNITSQESLIARCNTYCSWCRHLDFNTRKRP